MNAPKPPLSTALTAALFPLMVEEKRQAFVDGARWYRDHVASGIVSVALIEQAAIARYPHERP